MLTGAATAEWPDFLSRDAQLRTFTATAFAADPARGARTAMLPEFAQTAAAMAIAVALWARSPTGDGGVRIPQISSGVSIVEATRLHHARSSTGRSSAPRSIAAARESLADGPSSDSTVTVALDWLKDATGLSWERIGKLMHVSRETIDNWRKGGAVAPDNLERLLAVRDVVGRAAAHHPSQDELATWLFTPSVADGRTPVELLNAGEISRARLLAITSSSPGLKPMATWARRPIPEAFRQIRERRVEPFPPEPDAWPFED